MVVHRMGDTLASSQGRVRCAGGSWRIRGDRSCWGVLGAWGSQNFSAILAGVPVEQLALLDRDDLSHARVPDARWGRTRCWGHLCGTTSESDGLRSGSHEGGAAVHPETSGPLTAAAGNARDQGP
jgi:hypothetical protein